MGKRHSGTEGLLCLVDSCHQKKLSDNASQRTCGKKLLDGVSLESAWFAFLQREAYVWAPPRRHSHPWTIQSVELPQEAELCPAMTRRHVQDGSLRLSGSTTDTCRIWDKRRLYDKLWLHERHNITLTFVAIAVEATLTDGAPRIFGVL
jgi:hypothetical protein